MAGMDLSSTFGVIYWGFLVATILFGISVVQGYFFFVRSNDSWKLRAFVALLLVLDFSTTALSSESLHYYLIINFGNPLALLFMTRPYVAEYVITLAIIFLSQNFYAWRIYAVNRKIWTPLLIAFLATCALAGGIALTFELFAVDLLIGNLPEKRVMVCLSIATSFAAACDIVSTVAMCYYLASHRSAYKETNNLLRTLLFFTVNRGILAAVAQIGHLALFVAFPSKAYWMPFHLSVSKLHVNTLLAMLNSRATLRARSTATKLEISTDFMSAGQDSPDSQYTPSPRTPCSKRYSGGTGGLTTFELVNLPRDPRKRPSPLFSNIRRPPPGIEEEAEVESNEIEEIKPTAMLYTGGSEPITFA
ncbi:uncharacterized protein FOMMEDRAFT_171173 [Fomitiporia mediterranea MF3/22]|uniref:uncharacterized protein n=1 Tax=Fomitiporia mediterranea (strain MF3/22) TaxID=694068 RepID=UPI0004408324|nr:uncharacterized protein FOMMEDRAFT_171173 [Fomitiporia mediterranea MF3/22]EJC98236.1 hypothetical protein FOMMEDRAFT_171173 [Fomitiporia mediterranea MF3/22]